jgi:hypothetical protein
MILVEEKPEISVSYSPETPFTISNMWHIIEPNFQKKQIKGIEQLRIENK